MNDSGKTTQASPTQQHLEAFVIESRRHLLAFIESRVGDPHQAEDILQTSLLKALRAAPDLRDDEKLVPWFYRIVQHAIADARRKQQREEHYRVQYAQQRDLVLTPEDEAMICLCFRALLPTLKEEYRVLIEEMELNNRDPEEVAQRLGITRNNLNVRRYRARQQLRQRLEEVCIACPEDGYSDCAC
jgi:RNA polymerase sigma-70 factor (ECF subfamily)